MSARGGNRGKPAVDVKIDARLSAQRLLVALKRLLAVSKADPYATAPGALGWTPESVRAHFDELAAAKTLAEATIEREEGR